MGLMPITDAVFLLPERREQPMHVGGLQLFKLPPGAGPDWVKATYEEFLGASDIHPLFRKRPVRSLRSLGAWMWVEDEEIDLEHHVRHSALPQPGRVRELLALTSRLHGTLLDRQRPMWEVHLIEGLEDDRFAIYSKIHHSLLDGVSALRLLGRTLSSDPNEKVNAMWAPPIKPRQARSVPSATFLQSVSQTMGELAAAGPTIGLKVAEAVLAQGRQFAGIPPRTMLNVPITGSRRYAAQSWPIAEIRDVGRKVGGTVNDVVLAMCAGALREYLLSYDALPEQPLIAMTPVSLRSEDAEDAGNAVGAILCNLATDLEDPGDRMEAIMASMRVGKEQLAGLTQIQATILSAVMLAPLALSALAGFQRITVPPFNLIISNVPGPTETLYLNGAEMDGLYPLSIPVSGQALNITVTSYRGSLDFGLTGDRRALPHLQRLLGYLEDSLEDLRRVAGL